MSKCKVMTAGWLLGLLLCLLLFASAIPALAVVPTQNDAGAVAVEPTAVWSMASDEANVDARWFSIPNVSFATIGEIVFFAACLLTGYSLLTAGKRGWGWFALSIMLGMIAVITKIGLSMFVEVTRDYCPPDWDED